MFNVDNKRLRKLLIIEPEKLEYLLNFTYMLISITHCGNLLVKAFTGVMQKVFQHFGHLKEGEARFALLGRMVSGRTRRSGCSQEELLLFILLQQQVVKEALL